MVDLTGGDGDNGGMVRWVPAGAPGGGQEPEVMDRSAGQVRFFNEADGGADCVFGCAGPFAFVAPEGSWF